MIRNRKSIRLRGYDYSKPGAYFVTICVKDHAHLFGSIQNSAMRENEFGEIVRTCWNDLPRHYPSVKLDAFVIMPNHIHGIIVIVDDDHVGVGAGLKPAPTTNTNTPKHHGLPEIIRALKTFSARRINEIRKTPGIPVWQRNYYEHIVRSESALDQIRKYIANNPANGQISISNEFKQISGFGLKLR
jgi:REP element-mobilizing transposase RayT